MSTQTMEIYKCDLCGLQVEVINADACPPSCCGQTMRLMKENTTDGAKEKHVPVVSAQENGILVKVGEIPHPMEPDHYIEWIEVINGSYVNRYQLRPGEAPQAAFYVPMQPGLVIRAYCNKHGLWKK